MNQGFSAATAQLGASNCSRSSSALETRNPWREVWDSTCQRWDEEILRTWWNLSQLLGSPEMILTRPWWTIKHPDVSWFFHHQYMIIYNYIYLGISPTITIDIYGYMAVSIKFFGGTQKNHPVVIPRTSRHQYSLTNSFSTSPLCVCKRLRWRIRLQISLDNVLEKSRNLQSV